MRPSIKIAFLFAAIWFLGKMCFFWFQLFQGPEGVKFFVMWNILCLLLAISIGTLIEVKKEDRSQSTALGDIKKAMGGGMVYSVIVALLIYTYYAKIDPSFNQGQIEASIQRDRQFISTPKGLAEVRKDPEYQSLSVEEIMEKRKKGHQGVFSAGSTMTLSLLGMLLLTTINSIVVTIVYRRVLFKQRTI